MNMTIPTHPSWRARDRTQGIPTICKENTPGASSIGPIQPRKEQKIFDKKAIFDAFLSPGFEEYLQEHSIEHLIFCGVYADVCIDATCRTGFQKGYFVSVVPECTSSLLIEKEKWIELARKVYGVMVSDLRGLSPYRQAQL